MKTGIPMLLAALLLSACAGPPAQRYAGSAGSTYDKVQQPPQPPARQNYDPLRPIARQDFGNSGSPAPAPAASGAP